MDRYKDYLEIGKKIEIITRSTKGVVRFLSYLEEINKDSIIIGKPKNKHIGFNFTCGQNLELYAYTRGGVFKLVCRLEAYLENKCKLSLPISVDNIQRREYIRVNMGVDVIIRPKPATNIISLKTKTRNISAKGLNVLLDQDISRSASLEVSLLFPEKIITTTAKVIKVRQVEIESKTYFSTSLMFVAISEKEIDFIVKKCFEFEALQRKKWLENKI